MPCGPATVPAHGLCASSPACSPPQPATGPAHKAGAHHRLCADRLRPSAAHTEPRPGRAGPPTPPKVWTQPRRGAQGPGSALCSGAWPRATVHTGLFPAAGSCSCGRKRTAWGSAAGAAQVGLPQTHQGSGGPRTEPGRQQRSCPHDLEPHGHVQSQEELLKCHRRG